MNHSLNPTFSRQCFKKIRNSGKTGTGSIPVLFTKEALRRLDVSCGSSRACWRRRIDLWWLIQIECLFLCSWRSVLFIFYFRRGLHLYNSSELVVDLMLRFHLSVLCQGLWCALKLDSLRLEELCRDGDGFFSVPLAFPFGLGMF